MRNCHRALWVVVMVGLTSCRPPGPKAEEAPVDEEKTLPPGVTAPPMTPAQQKVADAVAEALHQPLIDKAMEEFRADHDRYPKDHDEFMSAIIEANAIELPPPPEGKRYQYDPGRHVLELVAE